MNSLKITSFVIFIIFLIIALLLVNRYDPNEGFISYAFNKQPIDFVWIPQYSKNDKNQSVVKLYDNIYFDSKNANLIEVDGNPDGNISNVDNIGNTITDVYVTKRDTPETTTNYKINNQITLKTDKDTVVSSDTPESLIDSVNESYTSFKYDSQSINTNSYSIFYLAWKKTTYIHIIDNSSITVPANNIGTFMFDNQGDMKKVMFSENSAVGLNTYIEDIDASNNTYVFMNEKYNPLFTKLPSYKENDKGALVFQISKYVRFDPQYGTLVILTEDSGTIWNIYDRYGKVWKQNTYFDEEIKTGISNVGFSSWSVVDKLGQNMVLFSVVGKKTLISIIQCTNNDSKKYSLVNVKRFNELGTVDYNENIRNNTKKASAIETFGSSDVITKADETRWKNISKLFWDTANNEPSPIYDDKTGRYLGDKTIIPPVCPSCSEIKANSEKLGHVGFSFLDGTFGSSASSKSASINGSSVSASRYGSSTPGSTRPGSSASRSTTPGSGASRSSTPGSTRPGSSTPGSTTPGSTTPGSSTPGSSASRSSTPGSSTPGSSTPGSSTPGSSASRSSTPGSTTTTSSTPGSTPGSTTSSTPGSTPGSTTSSTPGSSASRSSTPGSTTTTTSSTPGSTTTSSTPGSRSNGFTTLSQAYSEGDLKPNSMADDFIIRFDKYKNL